VTLNFFGSEKRLVRPGRNTLDDNPRTAPSKMETLEMPKAPIRFAFASAFTLALFVTTPGVPGDNLVVAKTESDPVGPEARTNSEESRIPLNALTDRFAVKVIHPLIGSRNRKAATYEDERSVRLAVIHVDLANILPYSRAPPKQMALCEPSRGRLTSHSIQNENSLAFLSSKRSRTAESPNCERSNFDDQETGMSMPSPWIGAASSTA